MGVCTVNARGHLPTLFNSHAFARWHCRNPVGRVFHLDMWSILLISVSLAPATESRPPAAMRNGLEQVSGASLWRHFNYRGTEVAHSRS
jgi:hypothetical protein